MPNLPSSENSVHQNSMSKSRCNTTKSYITIHHVFDHFVSMCSFSRSVSILNVILVTSPIMKRHTFFNHNRVMDLIFRRNLDLRIYLFLRKKHWLAGGWWWHMLISCLPQQNSRCFTQVVELLLSAAASPTLLDSRGQSPLHMAGPASISKLLLARAQVDQQDKHQSRWFWGLGRWGLDVSKAIIPRIGLITPVTHLFSAI